MLFLHLVLSVQTNARVSASWIIAFRNVLIGNRLASSNPVALSGDATASRFRVRRRCTSTRLIEAQSITTEVKLTDANFGRTQAAEVDAAEAFTGRRNAGGLPNLRAQVNCPRSSPVPANSILVDRCSSLSKRTGSGSRGGGASARVGPPRVPARRRGLGLPGAGGGAGR